MWTGGIFLNSRSYSSTRRSLQKKLWMGKISSNDLSSPPIHIHTKALNYNKESSLVISHMADSDIDTENLQS